MHKICFIFKFTDMVHMRISYVQLYVKGVGKNRSMGKWGMEKRNLE